jgi:hypothetical protein
VRTYTRPAALLCLLVLAGCNARFSLFAFEVAGPDGRERSIELRESPGAPDEREGRLEPSSDPRRSPVYRLARPLTVEAPGLAFVVAYASDIDAVRLTLLRDRDEKLLAMELPPTGDTTYRCQAALEPGTRVWGFQLEADAGEGSFALAGAGVEPLVHGFRIDADGLTFDGSIIVTGSSESVLTARLGPGLRDSLRSERWQLELTIPEGVAVIRLSTPGETSTVSASFTVAADGPRRVMLHQGSVGFLPRDLRVSRDAPDGLPVVASCTVSTVPDGAAIPSDPGLILGWRRSTWRRSDAEVFAWSRLPAVLIFDTATLEVQERFFRRLAFFVEKPETAGTVPSLESVEGRRSWNAHDYRAEDLARFFTLAVPGPFTEEELSLRDVLVAHGIIRADGDGFAPGTGAVLSISRESSDALRELLVTHEAFHGVFFALPAYRDDCQAAWDELTGDERAVWIGYLDLKGYNTADPYLVVNEFQSYLFQQERAAVPEFQAVTLRRVREAYPRLEPAVRRVEADRPDSFLASFDALDRALADSGGPPGGRVLGVRRTAP